MFQSFFFLKTLFAPCWEGSVVVVVGIQLAKDASMKWRRSIIEEQWLVELFTLWDIQFLLLEETPYFIESFKTQKLE